MWRCARPIVGGWKHAAPWHFHQLTPPLPAPLRSAPSVLDFMVWVESRMLVVACHAVVRLQASLRRDPLDGISNLLRAEQFAAAHGSATVELGEPYELESLMAPDDQKADDPHDRQRRRR